MLPSEVFASGAEAVSYKGRVAINLVPRLARDLVEQCVDACTVNVVDLAAVRAD
jgi:hypothetical protein